MPQLKCLQSLLLCEQKCYFWLCCSLWIKRYKKSIENTNKSVDSFWDVGIKYTFLMTTWVHSHFFQSYLFLFLPVLCHRNANRLAWSITSVDFWTAASIIVLFLSEKQLLIWWFIKQHVCPGRRQKTLFFSHFPIHETRRISLTSKELLLFYWRMRQSWVKF